MKLFVELKQVDAEGYGKSIMDELGFKQSATAPMVFVKTLVAHHLPGTESVEALIRPILEKLSDAGIKPRRVHSKVVDIGGFNLDAKTAVSAARPKKAPKPGVLDDKVREEINQKLTNNGLDGNGRFFKVGNALAVAQSILAAFGLEPDNSMNANQFNGPEGRATIDVAFSNQDDPHSPLPCKNSMLVVQWYRDSLEDSEDDSSDPMQKNLEVLAYLS